jgi:hypothetical protein
MRRQLLGATATLAVIAALGLSACGSSSTSSPSSGPTTAGSSSPTLPGNPGGSFCDQTRAFIAQVTQLSSGLVAPATPGATLNLTAYKQLIVAIARAVDQLDGSAPGAIASSFHTLRVAYDQASTHAQSAATLQQIAAAFQVIGTPVVKTADDSVTNYLKNTCGISTSPSP